MLAYGYFNYNQILFKSERFGGENVISGALLYTAVAAAVVESSIKYDKQKKNKVE